MRYPFMYQIGTIDYVTVDDMYKFAQANDKPLLSAYNAEFWREYVDNYSVYDRLFRRMYKTFHYFDQKPKINGIDNEDVEDVTSEFTDEVYAHLVMNSKRYSELYRIWTVSDTDYSITHGYLYNETHTESGGENTTSVDGTRNDTTTKTKGAQSNSENISYGAKTNTYTDEKGGHTDTKTTTDNAYTNSSTHQLQGFNSNTWQDSDKTINDNGLQQSTESAQYGSHIDTDTENLGAHTDTKTSTEGSRSDSESFSKGAQTNTGEKEYNKTLTINRYGNLGDQSVTDILEKHEKYWNRFNFYKLIFADICKEMLLVN